MFICLSDKISLILLFPVWLILSISIKINLGKYMVEERAFSHPNTAKGSL